MLNARYIPYELIFKRPSGTSRGILTTKPTFFIELSDEQGRRGIGECSPLPGLSPEFNADYEKKLQQVCQAVQEGSLLIAGELDHFPSIQFGLEMALRDLESQQNQVLYPSAFTEGRDSIPINGLVWMGDKAFMMQQVKEKLDLGFRCIKIKIGAIDFEHELALLGHIRKQFSAADIEIRVDANGAFSPDEALDKLQRLSEFELHSIEQPIKAGQHEAMHNLCRTTPFPIALDEELIGVFDLEQKKELLSAIRPQYVILKPSLVGGYRGSSQWISSAKELGIDWWLTSALESNVGLNAIAQWCYTLHSDMPQGLGTGQLYTNNIDSPLYLHGDQLYYQPDGKWHIEQLYRD